MKYLLRSVLWVLPFLLACAAGAEVVDRIVAIVNDDVITLSDLRGYVQVETKGKYQSINEYYRSIQIREKIDGLVNDALIRQQAKKLKVDVSDREVQAVIENIKKQYLITEEELKERLAKENVSYKGFVEGMRMNILRSKVLNRMVSPDVTVNDKILREFYEQHKNDYREEEFRLQQIFISGNRADAQARALNAYNLLKQGSAFEAVAGSFSDDPSGAKGGEIGFVRGDELIPQLHQALSLLMPGMYTQPLPTPYGWTILKLLEVKKGETASFESLKERIHGRYVQEESEKRYKEYMEKLRKSSYIEVKI